jgi:integrase
LRRPGWVWVSEDIAKGPRGRWVPVLPELADTFDGCAEQLGDQDFVLPLRRSNLHGRDRVEWFDPSLPMAYESLYRAVGHIGRRAGIRANVTPHLMRHAFGDHVAKHAGLKVAQFVLGHESVSTTEGYTGAPSLDEVAHALAGFGYGERGLPAEDRASRPVVAAADRFRLY